MAQENNHGVMNTQNNAPKQVQGNKSLFKDETFRKGVYVGAGTTLGGVAVCFLGKKLINKISTAWKARKAAAAAAAAQETKEPEGKK